jgi:putative transposase
MPSRHIVKEYAADSYYHIYTRGVDGRQIFLSPDDFSCFITLLKRYLDAVPHKDKESRVYPNFSAELELVAFCLMGNHLHLYVYQSEARAITAFMRALLTSYTMYFNREHKRSGSLFQSHYHAERTTQEAYLLHITRYIHLLPGNYRHYPYSSYPYYIGQKQAEWLHPDKAIDLLTGHGDYETFVTDLANYKHTLEEVKSQLADQ